MTSCGDIQSQLSELLDDGLSPDVQHVVRAHVAECAICAGVADDLQRVREVARTLGPMDPPARLWRHVAAQVSAASPRSARTLLFGSVPAWAAVAALLVLTVSLIYFVRSSVDPQAGGNARAAGSVKTFEQELAQAEQQYERAIAELEGITSQEAQTLDPAVDDTLRRSLMTIDAAIAESRQALTADPGNEPARASLFDALQQKVGVLQAKVVLTNGPRVGTSGADREPAARGRKS